MSAATRATSAGSGSGVGGMCGYSSSRTPSCSRRPFSRTAATFSAACPGAVFFGGRIATSKKARSPRRSSAKGNGATGVQPSGTATSRRPFCGLSELETSVTSIERARVWFVGQTSRSGSTATSTAGAHRIGRRISPTAWSL